MKKHDYSMALDTGESVRVVDDNGNLHVKCSHLTKVQIREYWGHEIPGHERAGLDPSRVYRGYCPAEELSKQKTSESVNGIPIQFRHHPDFPEAPALDTRVGSTGTDGAFNYPYLDNSLHFTVQDAIDRIRDGSMRELSLAYRYTPDFTPGETEEGEPYDFIMRDISANHVALVEEGRAGPDVLVADSKGVNTMGIDTTVADTDNTSVEAKEVALAKTIAGAAEELKDMHEQNEEGVVDNEAASDDDKVDVVKGIIAKMVEKGISPEDAEAMMAPLMTGAEDDDEPQAVPEATDEDDVKPVAAVDEDQIVKDAMAACGYDEESPEAQRAFTEGVLYGIKNADGAKGAEDEDGECAKDEDGECAQDEDGESESPAPAALSQDAARRAKKAMIDHFVAMDECKRTLGKIRIDAFDSASGVYRAALKREGVDIRMVPKGAERATYLAFMKGRYKNRGMASDSARKAAPTALSAKLHKIRKGC